MDKYFAEKLKISSSFFFVSFLKRYCINRMDRLRREDDGKGRQIKKAQDAEQSLLSKVPLNFQNRIVVAVLMSEN